MSTGKKESIGFKTTAKTIEEQYASIFNEIGKREMNWQRLYKLSQEQCDTATEWAQKSAGRNAKDDATLALVSCAGWLNASLLSRLGIELNDIAERLTRLEKNLAPRVKN